MPFRFFNGSLIGVRTDQSYIDVIVEHIILHTDSVILNIEGYNVVWRHSYFLYILSKITARYMGLRCCFG